MKTKLSILSLFLFVSLAAAAPQWSMPADKMEVYAKAKAAVTVRLLQPSKAFFCEPGQAQISEQAGYITVLLWVKTPVAFPGATLQWWAVAIDPDPADYHVAFIRYGATAADAMNGLLPPIGR